MHVWSDPAVERVPVLTELFCPRVLDHICIGEPLLSVKLAFSSGFESSCLTMPGTPHTPLDLGLSKYPKTNSRALDRTPSAYLPKEEPKTTYLLPTIKNNLRPLLILPIPCHPMSQMDRNPQLVLVILKPRERRSMLRGRMRSATVPSDQRRKMRPALGPKEMMSPRGLSSAVRE